MKQQQASLLRADFDAVFSVNAEAPFLVLGANQDLDSIVQVPMSGQSIVSRSASVEEKTRFLQFLEL